MSNFSPYQTTAQNMDAVLSRDAKQRENQGGKQVIESQLIHIGDPGTGACKWAAKFTYDDGTNETLWGSGK